MEHGFWEAHYDYVELEQLREIRDAAETAMAKVAEHRRKGYGHIRVGTFDGLSDVLGRYGSTAARLDALAIELVDLPCDDDGSAA